VTDKLKYNAVDLASEMEWFARIIDARLNQHFGKETEHPNIGEINAPSLDNSKSPFGDFINHYKLTFAERLALALGLAPHVRPEILDVFLQRNTSLERGYSEFGGIKGNSHGGFLPTGETLMFILAAHNLEARFSLEYLFDRDHFFSKHNILRLEEPSTGEPTMSGALRLSKEYVDYFTTGDVRKPKFTSSFPAKLLTTKLEWDDLVLEHNTLQHIEEIMVWLEHGKTLMEDWGLHRKLRPGYRCLYYGPPGTGKTMTACLLGRFGFFFLVL